MHRFHPRYAGVAWTAIGVGGACGVGGIAAGIVGFPLAIGAIGISLGLLYLGSPSWRMVVVTDEDGLEVRTTKATKFRLAWRDVKRVVVSEPTHTAFVDSGVPETSLLVPGDGAPAPYEIHDAATLVATILAHVTPDRIERVESLDRAPKSDHPA